MWAQIINTLLGIWLMFTPAVLNVSDAAATNDRIVGPFVVSFAFISLWDVLRPVRRVNLLLGLWMVMAPWILDNPATATLNETLVGLTIAGLSLVRGTVKTPYGGGWRTLLCGNPEWREQLQESGAHE